MSRGGQGILEHQLELRKLVLFCLAPAASRSTVSPQLFALPCDVSPDSNQPWNERKVLPPTGLRISIIRDQSFELPVVLLFVDSPSTFSGDALSPPHGCPEPISRPPGGHPLEDVPRRLPLLLCSTYGALRDLGGRSRLGRRHARREGVSKDPVDCAVGEETGGHVDRSSSDCGVALLLEYLPHA